MGVNREHFWFQLTWIVLDQWP